VAAFNPFMFGNPASVGQQTAVGQTILARSAGARGGRKSAAKRRKAKAAATRARPRKRAGKKARLVKGSPAAKAYMAKIRRKRK